MLKSLVAVDINPDAVMVARNRLDFAYTPLDADYVAGSVTLSVVQRDCQKSVDGRAIYVGDGYPIDS